MGSLLALSGAVAILLPGCSRPVGTVSGTVTYQGKPLQAGNVSFVSTDGGQSFAAGLNESGNYKVPNILGGSYKVCVETTSFKPAAQGVPAGPGGKGPAIPPGKGGPPPGAEVPEGYTPSSPAALAAAQSKKKYVPIPEKYAKDSTTDLSFTFKGGDATFDIELK